MKWLTSLITSSIGRKLIMSLTGLFLCSFLVIHLIGNLQLLVDDKGVAFNDYAYFMTHFLPIKIVSWGLYAMILLHAILGLLIWAKNKKMKGKGYKGGSGAKGSWASKNMALLGTLILAFIFIHMGDFWFKMKWTNYFSGPLMVDSEALGFEVKNLYARVAEAFSNPLIVIAYVIGQLVLAFHLWHGFASGFVTLGLNNKKYTPIIETIGRVFAVVVPLGFVLIPIFHYLGITF
jgi:succinate dehydrogenase / fumarate reductase cytochrome b subunit